VVLISKELEEIKVNKAINEFIEELKKKPYNFWSEYDMQVFLSIKLDKYDIGAKTSIPGGIKVKRVHREYFGYVKNSRTDIVIFDKEDMKNIIDIHNYPTLQIKYKPYEERKGYYRKLKGMDEWKLGKDTGRTYRPIFCSHLIELKTNDGSVKGAKIENEILKDFKKLRYNFEIQESKPELHFILVMRWDIKDASKVEDQKTLMKKIKKDSKKTPKINVHVVGWPEELWNEIYKEAGLI